MRQDAKGIIVIIALAILIIGGALLLDNNNAQRLCEDVAEKVNVIETKAGPFGCFAQTTDGLWIKIAGVEQSHAD